MVFTVGLSGGIGSGKTTVSDIFSSLGVCIVDTDVIARNVVALGSPCLKQIADHFGPNILHEDGSLHRKMLRGIVFEKTKEKIWLESLLHPVIRQHTRETLAQCTSDYAILSSPLLLQSPDEAIVDRILIVDVPEDMQFRRTSQRDNASEEKVKKIAATQLDRHQRLAKADDIIDNSGSLESTRQQVLKLHKLYRQLAAN